MLPRTERNRWIVIFLRRFGSKSCVRGFHGPFIGRGNSLAIDLTKRLFYVTSRGCGSSAKRVANWRMRGRGEGGGKGRDRRK